MRIAQLLLLMFCCIVLVSCKSVEEPQSELDIVVNKIRRATDPHNKADKVKTLFISSKTTMNGLPPEAKVAALYQFPDKVKTYTSTPNGPGLITTIYNNGQGVEKLFDRVEMMTPEGLIEKKFDLVKNNPRSTLKDIYPGITLAPEKVEINGRLCYHFTAPVEPFMSPEPLEMFYDAETYLPVQMKVSQETQSGKITGTVKPLEFKDFDGFKIYTRLEIKMMGITGETVITAYEVNPKVAAGEFDLPAVTE